MSVTFDLRDLEMFWRGRGRALRAISIVQPLTDATIATAETYETCADEIKASLDQEAETARILLRVISDKIGTRLNNHLCEMKPGYDDSITGFNDAWEIVSAVLKGEMAKLGAGALT